MDKHNEKLGVHKRCSMNIETEISELKMQLDQMRKQIFDLRRYL